jgi:uncharacterized protein (DUF427 family)
LARVERGFHDDLALADLGPPHDQAHFAHVLRRASDAGQTRLQLVRRPVLHGAILPDAGSSREAAARSRQWGEAEVQSRCSVVLRSRQGALTTRIRRYSEEAQRRHGRKNAEDPLRTLASPTRVGAGSGARRSRRNAMKAVWSGQVIAESDDTVVVEGNHYFPASSLRPEFFRESDTTTVCAWKGVASYRHVVVGERENKDAAWTYRVPKPAAAEIAGRFAFWKGVEVVD